jgi:hypothetical protein
MMDHLKIDGSQSTPHIDCEPEGGVVTMRGDSYPENSFEFFAPVLSWIETYLRQTERPLTFNLTLLYLNTSSVKVMMDIFDLLELAHGNGRRVAVNWYYDEQNERVGELASEFKEDCTFPFAIVHQTA